MMTEQAKANVYPWVRTLISVVSIIAGCASIVWTQAQNNQSAIDHFNELKGKVERVDSAVTNMQGYESDQRREQGINNEKVADKLQALSDTISATNRHLEADDTRMSQMEGSLKILDTNQQLLNQQLQYIGTSHIVPSMKK